MSQVPLEGTPLPAWLTARPGAPADLEAVHHLVSAVDAAVLGEPETTLDDLRAEWSLPRFAVARDVVVVVTDTGRVVGYLSVQEESPGIELRADIYGHPDVLADAPIERHLAERAVLRAQHAADQAQSRLALLAYAVAGEPLEQDLDACGFDVRRRFWRMVIDLDDVAVEALPPDLTIEPLDLDRDLVEVHAVLTDAFATHWGSHGQTLEDWRARHLDRADADPSLWRVARRGGEVIGAVVAQEQAGLDFGWISTVGVRENTRGQGIAGALLRATFGGLADRGLRRAMLGVDSQNDTGATRLYERAGMRVLFVICAWVRDFEPSGERTA
ncbi:MAG TPA: GNAT family N-acetyltransferase [Nitriliruptorales bacterium]